MVMIVDHTLNAVESMIEPNWTAALVYTPCTTHRSTRQSSLLFDEGVRKKKINRVSHLPWETPATTLKWYSETS